METNNEPEKTMNTESKWTVWSPEFKVVSEHNTRSEAEYFAKAYGEGYWVSQN